MKILFDHAVPFFLAHGGAQTQIEQTRAVLERLGLEVEPVRWWDSGQTGDVIHYFGRPPAWYIDFAQEKGFMVVFADFLGAVGARSRWELWLQKFFISSARALAPKNLLFRLAWESYRTADACIALTSWEAYLMEFLFRVPKDRLHVIPNGVDDAFCQSQSQKRGKWLVCTATINRVKRVVELAEAAVIAQTPLWVIGRAYSQGDEYTQAFFNLAKRYPQYLRYEGATSDREHLARAYREARGFVLLSQWESLSISALEAAACECPLLLSDLPWARSVFKNQAMYCPVSSPKKSAGGLKQFYAQAPELPKPSKPKSWSEVGQELQTLYQTLAGKS